MAPCDGGTLAVPALDDAIGGNDRLSSLCGPQHCIVYASTMSVRSSRTDL